MAFLAMMGSMVVGRSEARRYGWDIKSMSWLVVNCTLLGFVGAHITYVFTRFDLPWNQWWRTFIDFRSGFVWYGGFFTSWALCYFYARTHKINPRSIFDVGSLIICVAQGIGRIGCFFQGCCYGVPTKLPWGITLDTPEFGLEKVHPTQIYQLLFLALLFLFLWRKRVRIRYNGQTAVHYCLIEPIGRFLIELFRGDSVRGFVVSGLSTSQALAIAIFSLGLFLRTYFQKTNAQALSMDQGH